jgi:hypothetical protein
MGVSPMLVRKSIGETPMPRYEIRRIMKSTIRSALVLMFLMTGCAVGRSGTKTHDQKPVVQKPPTVTREQWGSQPQEIPESRKHTPKFVTIHHAGVTWKAGSDPQKFVSNMQKWGQREKNWPDLAYHFMIAPDGRIFEARRIEYEPESNTKYDLQGHIGVELMGNFQVQRVSEAQLSSVVKLAAWLCQDLHIDPSQIAGHKDRAKNQTDCPGRDMYRYIENGQVKKWVEEALAGKQPRVKLGNALPNGPTTMIGEDVGGDVREDARAAPAK